MSRRAIIAAFLANLGIALSKFVAFVLTGAASMLAEAIHSLADTGNQGLLMLGGTRSLRPADEVHPFGYGTLALLLGVRGRARAVQRRRAVRDLRRRSRSCSIRTRSTDPACGDRGAARERRASSRSRCAPRCTRAASEREGQSILQFVRRTKIPELAVVVLEDIGALVGLAFALVGVVLAERAARAALGRGGKPRDRRAARGDRDRARDRDGEPARRRGGRAGGRRADPGDSRRVTPGSMRVIALRTQHVGPDDIMVNAKLEFDADAHARRACPRS